MFSSLLSLSSSLCHLPDGFRCIATTLAMMESYVSTCGVSHKKIQITLCNLERGRSLSVVPQRRTAVPAALLCNCCGIHLVCVHIMAYTIKGSLLRTHNPPEQICKYAFKVAQSILRNNARLRGMMTLAM